MKPSTVTALFYTPAEVAALFRHEDDARFAYRHARPRGFLAPAARRFGRMLLFDRGSIESLINEKGKK